MRWGSEARLAASELVDALWPRACALCGAAAADGVACAAHALPSGPDGARCERCSMALPPGIPDGSRCAACRRRAPGWSRLVVLGDYTSDAPLREWILAFKHGGRPELARWLAPALARRARDAIQPGDQLVPVPLHPLRRLERGYDQAARLALELAARTGLEARAALARVRDTPPQGSWGPRSRTSNVDGAFAATRRARTRGVGARVWLVDDVVTAGATAAACARVLRALGAREVGVLALARAVPDPGGYPLPP